MYTRNRIRLRVVWHFARRHVFHFAGYAALVTAAYTQLGWRFLAIPFLPISTVGIGVAFYLGFKNNGSHERLWEARTLWGSIINHSRCFGNQGLYFLSGGNSESETRDLLDPKTTRKWLFVSCLSILLLGCRSSPTQRHGRVIRIDHIVDLTHTLTADFPFIPVKQLTYPFALIPMATLEANGVEANSWRIHEHLGTHIDAPNHFIKNQPSLDQIDLHSLIVPLAVIDIEAEAAGNPDAQLTVQDIEQYEKQFGKIPAHACVVMYSGWEKRLRDPSFVGLDRQHTKHYPGFSTEAIGFLLTKRQIAGLGVDVLSLDPGVDENYTGHKMLFAAGKWGLECVANLAQVPPSGATIIVGAPKVGQATGGFSRVMAVW